VDTDRLRTLPPFEARNLLEDGNYGGRSQRSDNDQGGGGGGGVVMQAGDLGDPRGGVPGGGGRKSLSLFFPP